MAFDQGELNFDKGPEDGFHNWRRDLEQRQRAFERRFGVIIGKPVRVSLVGHRHELEGKILLIGGESAAKATHLQFELKGVSFTASDIESIVRID
jgi:hypothetical protein